MLDGIDVSECVPRGWNIAHLFGQRWNSHVWVPRYACVNAGECGQHTMHWHWCDFSSQLTQSLNEKKCEKREKERKTIDTKE